MHAQRVVSRSVLAMRYGVQVGMRRRHAQALCPDLEIAAFEPNRDRRAFNTIVRAVSEVVPLIEVSEPGVIVFAARGPSRYFGGDEPMAKKVMQILQTSIVADSQFGIGVADSRLAAHIAARISAETKTAFLVEPDQTRLWLAPQTVRVLSEFANVSRETISLLERLGLNTLQDVCKLGESVLAGRFGELGVELHRLARGDEQHPLAAIAPPPAHLCLRVFEEPINDQQTLLNNIKVMAGEFSEYFSQQGAVCVRVIIKFESESGDRLERLWYRPQGLTATTILESAKWQIESWLVNESIHIQITQVQLIADEVRTDIARQLKLWGGVTQTDETATQAINRLTELLGSSSVQRVKWQGGRDLQDNYQLVAASQIQASNLAPEILMSATTQQSKWRGSLPTPSPSVVYSDLVVVQVTDKDKNLLRVSARHELSAEPAYLLINKTCCKIISWAGPWPVEEKWWDITRSRRLVRLQVVVEKILPDGSSQIQALLVALEHGEWSIAAIYG